MKALIAVRAMLIMEDQRERNGRQYPLVKLHLHALGETVTIITIITIVIPYIVSRITILTSVFARH